MKNIIKILSVIFIFALSSCDTNGFKELPSGLKYKFILQNKGAQLPELGDLLEVVMSYSYNDSIIFNSADFSQSLPIKLEAPSYKGDIIEGMAMMGLGDSAVFIISADSFFLKNVGLKSLPDFINPNSQLVFNIGLLSIKKKEVFEKEMEAYNKQREAFLDIRKNEEAELLLNYLKQNNINVEPRPSGLYYIPKKTGKGAKALNGKSVSVHYTGFLLNGQAFDSSYDRQRPITFKMGSGRVIPGFEEGISLMQEGGTATIIVPAHLAYEEEELENIPPLSTLVYELELVSVE